MKRGLILAGLILVGAVSFCFNAYAEPVEAGFGKVKVNGLLQFWYQNDNGAKPKGTYRLRRAEVKLSGEITPQVSWAIMIDPSQVREDDVKTKGGNVTSVGRKSVLQNFLISLKPIKGASIDFGQYKVPFGMEGLESSAKLDLIERSAITSQFKWADARDIGFTVKGDCKISNVKIQPAVGVFNGEGQNKLDVNETKDIVGRLVVKPIELLHLGVAHYNGKKDTTETENVRTGVEIKFVKEPVSVYGEYAVGKSDNKSKTIYYATATYKFHKSFQVAARYDNYDPDTDKDGDAKTDITFGLNYFIEKHNAKIQLNYVLRGEEETPVDNDVIRVNVQVSY